MRSFLPIVVLDGLLQDIGILKVYPGYEKSTFSIAMILQIEVTAQTTSSVSSLPSSPSPFSHWEKGSRIEVPRPRERDLGSESVCKLACSFALAPPNSGGF